MLSKRRKLNLRQHPNFFGLAKRLFFPHLTCFYLLNHNKSGFLSTVVVPKKVSLKATDRNKLRRNVYQVIENNYSTLQQKNLCVVLVLKPQAKSVSSRDLNEAVEDSLRQLINL
jgi:ribonuclease P protein component